MSQISKSIVCGLVLAATWLSACGYTSGSGLHGQNVRTVHLRAIENDTFRQRLEVELSAAVSRELSVSSDLLPASATQADAILDLRITNERERTLVTGDRASPVREGAQEVYVHVLLTDRRSGKKLVERTVVDRAEFRSPLGENLSTARAELVEDLARKIVLALETPF